jgi:hypothetical protein
MPVPTSKLPDVKVLYLSSSYYYSSVNDLRLILEFLWGRPSHVGGPFQKAHQKSLADAGWAYIYLVLNISNHKYSGTGLSGGISAREGEEMQQRDGVIKFQ